MMNQRWIPSGSDNQHNPQPIVYTPGEVRGYPHPEPSMIVGSRFPSAAQALAAGEPNAVAGPPQVETPEGNTTSEQPRVNWDCVSYVISSSNNLQRPAAKFGSLRIRKEWQGRNTTDQDLIHVLRRIYQSRPRPPFQRFYSLLELKSIQMVELTDQGFPIPLPVTATLRHDLIHVFRRPDTISTEQRWLDLGCGLAEDAHHDHGLLFIEDWDGKKITLLVGLLCVISMVIAIIWIAVTGDVQAAMAVSSYVLSATTVALALLGVLSSLEC